MTVTFPAAFAALTDHSPLRWQVRLFERFADADLPDACDIPTGLGKTSVVPIWLIALAQGRPGGAPGNRVPRRLIYVVNRRTVVDQATDVAERIRTRLVDKAPSDAVIAMKNALQRLSSDPGEPLAISTLRGEFADNRKWQEDPARAAIIIGTVDMIGSRLLFSGYGVSQKMRPFHAGLLGQDALIVHDEAHLTLAFGKLIKDIAQIQRAAGEPRPIRVMELSATRRGGTEAEDRFILTPEEAEDAEVARRLRARKILRSHAPKQGVAQAETIAGIAASHETVPARVVVYVQTPQVAKAVAALLPKERVATLTGTIRGHERDQLASTPLDEIEDPAARERAALFHGFRTDPMRKPPGQTQYLVATSAGEVGIDLDADHMVCDVTTLDSMVQRLGRVNRLGQGSAVVDVVDGTTEKKSGAGDSDYEARVAATRAALERLPPLGDGTYDASPAALWTLLDRLGKERMDGGRTRLDACFSATPRMVTLTDILLDAWSMTRLEDLPGRRPVERWLHGITSEPPSVHVAWRREVGDVVEVADDQRRPVLKALFDKHAILSRERLRGNRQSVVEELKKIAKRLTGQRVILQPAHGDPSVEDLSELLTKENEERLREATVVLPTDAGGLDERGMLDGTKTAHVSDVADWSQHEPGPGGKEAASGAPGRMRVLLAWDDETRSGMAEMLGTRDTWPVEAPSLRAALNAVRSSQRLADMREKARIVLARDKEGGETKVFLLLARRGSPDAAEGSEEAAGKQPVDLAGHNDDVRREAERLVGRLGLAQELDPLGGAAVLAAERHDLGKNRRGWQKAIGHPPPQGDRGEWTPWAKSDQRGFDDTACGKYRHEFGSLRDAAADPVVSGHAERDLILHLIAAHHGWARPHFRPEHGDIADDAAYDENDTAAVEAMRRFARLQRRFGHWGLAWLEALLRAADYRVSARIAPDERGSEEEETP